MSYPGAGEVIKPSGRESMPQGHQLIPVGDEKSPRKTFFFFFGQKNLSTLSPPPPPPGPSELWGLPSIRTLGQSAPTMLFPPEQSSLISLYL